MLAASNKFNKYLITAGYTKLKEIWILDMSMASLFICRLGVLPWMAILLNLVIFLLNSPI